jgi:hypothetical protein
MRVATFDFSAFFVTEILGKQATLCLDHEATPCDSCSKRPRCQTEALASLAFQYWSNGFSLQRVAGFPRPPTAAILGEIKAPKRKKKKLIARRTIQDVANRYRVNMSK